jgi:chain length determinant protein EpsF
MTFRQLLLALRARWKTTAGVFLACVAASVLAFTLSTRLYTAAATVVVDSKADPVSGGAYATQMSTGYISTQVDIISSPRVAQRVVKLLKMDQAADSIQSWRESTGGKGDLSAWLGAKLEKTLTVTPSRDSSVIEIAVTWTDPATAAILANAFAQAYFDTDIELKVEPARQYASWFDERSRALRADLEEKQKRLADYQAKTGIVATDGRLDIENARLNELSSQLVSIQALRQESESRQHQINGDPQSMPEVLQSPVIAGLKADLSRAEGKLSDVGTNLGKNHPDYQNTAAEVAALKARIADESARIAASLGNNTQVMLRRENEIRAALEAQKKRMWDMTHQHDEATELQNDVATAQRNLDTVTQRLAQSNLESQTEQTNVVLLTKAVPPLFRSSPRLSIDLLLGTLLGAILSVGTAVFLEMQDRRVREDSELMELLDVPLFGKMPHIKPESRNPRAPASRMGQVEPSPI